MYLTFLATLAGIYLLIGIYHLAFGEVRKEIEREKTKMALRFLLKSQSNRLEWIFLPFLIGLFGVFLWPIVLSNNGQSS